jgi:hypothetical protein
MFESPLTNLDIARRTVIDRRAAADRDRLVRRARSAQTYPLRAR